MMAFPTPTAVKREAAKVNGESKLFNINSLSMISRVKPSVKSGHV